MPKLLPLLGALATAITAVIGTTITKQALRDRIFEIDLKPDRSAADKALREYLSQQLNDPC